VGSPKPQHSYLRLLVADCLCFGPVLKVDDLKWRICKHRTWGL